MDTKGFEIKELNEKGEGRAVVATLNVIDRDNDVCLSNAFGEQAVPMAPAHNWEEVPIGKARIHEQGNEAIAHFKLNLKTRLGKNWYESIKFDLEYPPALQQWSYGYAPPAPPDHFFGEFDGQKVRFFRRVEVNEVSPVLLGAGINTRTVALKGAPSANGLLDVRRIEKSMEQRRAALLAYDFEQMMLNSKRYREVFHADEFFDTCYILARMAAEDIAIEVPQIKFFRETGPSERVDFTMRRPILGNAPGGAHEIWIREDQRGETLIDTIGHEIAHTAGAEEEDARRYAKRFTERFGRVPDDAKLFVLAGKELDPWRTFEGVAEINDRLFDLNAQSVYRRGRLFGMPRWELERQLNWR